MSDGSAQRTPSRNWSSRTRADGALSVGGVLMVSLGSVPSKSTAHERRQLQETHADARLDHDLFFQRIYLAVADQDQEAAQFKRLHRLGELLFPVELPRPFQAEAVERPLGVGGLDQAAKD